MGAIIKNTKTLVLKPGECVIFPADIVINAIIPTGSISVSSTCSDILPSPTGYKCWQFIWEANSFGSDYNDAYFISITIDGIEYPFVDTGVPNSWDNGGDFLQSTLSVSTPAGLCNVLCNAGGTAVSPKIVTVEIPEYLGRPLIKYTNPGFEFAYLIPREDQCGC